MSCAGILLLGSLVSMQVPHNPTYGDTSSMVSCNKQGTVFDEVYASNFNNPTSAQIILNGTAIWQDVRITMANLREIGRGDLSFISQYSGI
jgi:hypothetical protein